MSVSLSKVTRDTLNVWPRSRQHSPPRALSIDRAQVTVAPHDVQPRLVYLTVNVGTPLILFGDRLLGVGHV